MFVAFNAKGDLSDLPNFDLSPRIKKGSAKKGSDGTLSVTLRANTTTQIMARAGTIRKTASIRRLAQ